MLLLKLTIALDQLAPIDVEMYIESQLQEIKFVPVESDAIEYQHKFPKSVLVQLPCPERIFIFPPWFPEQTLTSAKSCPVESDVTWE